MPKGRLVVAGELQFRQFYSLAVIGGTGLYDNARGTLSVTRMGTRSVRELSSSGSWAEGATLTT